MLQISCQKCWHSNLDCNSLAVCLLPVSLYFSMSFFMSLDTLFTIPILTFNCYTSPLFSSSPYRWLYQERSWFTTTPSNFSLLEVSILFPNMFTNTSLQSFYVLNSLVPSTNSFDFSPATHSLLSFSHSTMLSVSFCIFSCSLLECFAVVDPVPLSKVWTSNEQLEQAICQSWPSQERAMSRWWRNCEEVATIKSWKRQ